MSPPLYKIHRYTDHPICALIEALNMQLGREKRKKHIVIKLYTFQIDSIHSMFIITKMPKYLQFYLGP